MPEISVEALMKIIAQQDAHIKELKMQNDFLKMMLAKQDEIRLVNDLANLVESHPEKLPNTIIASLHKH